MGLPVVRVVTSLLPEINYAQPISRVYFSLGYAKIQQLSGSSTLDTEINPGYVPLYPAPSIVIALEILMKLVADVAAERSQASHVSRGSHPSQD